MAFIKSNGLDSILRNIQQNIFMPFHTVHDEVDLIVDSNLVEGIAKRASELGAVKHVMDKIGTGYIDFVYDIEFDPDGSWLPKTSLPIYAMPSCEDEARALEQCQASEVEPEHITLNIDNIKDFTANVEYDPIDGAIVTLVSPAKTITSRKLVSKIYIDKFQRGAK